MTAIRTVAAVVVLSVAALAQADADELSERLRRRLEWTARSHVYSPRDAGLESIVYSFDVTRPVFGRVGQATVTWDPPGGRVDVDFHVDDPAKLRVPMINPVRARLGDSLTSFCERVARGTVHEWAMGTFWEALVAEGSTYSRTDAGGWLAVYVSADGSRRAETTFDAKGLVQHSVQRVDGALQHARRYTWREVGDDRWVIAAVESTGRSPDHPDFETVQVFELEYADVEGVTFPSRIRHVVDARSPLGSYGERDGSPVDVALDETVDVTVEAIEVRED